MESLRNSISNHTTNQSEEAFSNPKSIQRFYRPFFHFSMERGIKNREFMLNLHYFFHRLRVIEIRFDIFSGV